MSLFSSSLICFIVFSTWSTLASVLPSLLLQGTQAAFFFVTSDLYTGGESSGTSWGLPCLLLHSTHVIWRKPPKKRKSLIVIVVLTVCHHWMHNKNVPHYSSRWIYCNKPDRLALRLKFCAKPDRLAWSLVAVIQGVYLEDTTFVIYSVF